MSAFQLPETHLGAIAKFAIRNNRGAGIHAYFAGSTRTYDFTDICTVLAAECYRSVRTRYPSGQLPGPNSASDGPVTFTLPQSMYATLEPVDVLKACCSYAYQTCESGNYEETEAYALIQAIEAAAVRALPGFKESPAWEIDYTESDWPTAKAVAMRESLAAAQAHCDAINREN